MAAPLLCVALAACGQDAVPPAAPRSEGALAPMGRFVLFRSGPDGAPLFLDRFETTRGDVREFYRQRGEAVPEELVRVWEFHDLDARGTPRHGGNHEDWPAAGVTLAEAQAIAAWRLGRLPTAGEWAFATGGVVGYRFPWGDTFRGYLCNTDELDLRHPTAVGTFDPGGYSSGTAFCFDLVGNVAEIVRVPEPERVVRDDEAEAVPPPVEDAGRGANWVAVGWHYLHRYKQGESPVEDGAIGPLMPADRECTVGFRVATDPDTLLGALLARASGLPEAERRAVAPFLSAYAEVFAPALQRSLQTGAGRQLETERWLCHVLGVRAPR